MYMLVDNIKNEINKMAGTVINLDTTIDAVSKQKQEKLNKKGEM